LEVRVEDNEQLARKVKDGSDVLRGHSGQENFLGKFTKGGLKSLGAAGNRLNGFCTGNFVWTLW
jgi:hypothetical protein